MDDTQTPQTIQTIDETPLENPTVVTEGEVIESTESTEPAEVSMQLDVLIKKYLADIDKSKAELREVQSMLKDAIANDADYQALNTQSQELSRKRKSIQDKILQLPSLQEAKNKVETVKDDIKNATEMLAAYLERYVNESGSRTIEDDKGEVLEIVPAYKLTRPNKH